MSDAPHGTKYYQFKVSVHVISNTAAEDDVMGFVTYAKSLSEAWEDAYEMIKRDERIPLNALGNVNVSLMDIFGRLRDKN
jgi:hypothetical protein